MIKRSSKTLVLGGVLLLMYFSCKDNGVVPPGEDCRPSVPTDTTSHNFIWRFDTLGEGNGSVLNDVFIINDTLAYAVGEVYLKDSTGQYDPLPYNAAIWNGVRWTLKRISVTFRGNLITPPIEGVFAFSPAEVWMVASLPIFGDGTSWTMYDLRTTLNPNISLSKAWGSNSQFMYFVGRAGNVVLRNGNGWQKLASGTTIDIQDIWGATNCRGEQEVLAIASQGVQVPQARQLLRITGTTVTTVADAGLPLALEGVWLAPLEKYFAVGNGLFFTVQLGNSWTKDSGFPTYYQEGIRGLTSNDIVVVGDFGNVSHFNGSTWRHYTGLEVPYINGNYYAVSVHPRLVAAVGELPGGKAVALIGKR